MKMADEYRFVTGGRPEMYIRATSAKVCAAKREHDQPERRAIQRPAPTQPAEHGETEGGEVEPLAIEERAPIVEPGFEGRVGLGSFPAAADLPAAPSSCAPRD